MTTAHSRPFHAVAGALAALVVALAPAAARADLPTVASPEGLATRYGEYFLLGGGVTDFTDGEAKDLFDPGVAWEARLGFGSRSYLGAEVAYVGASREGVGSVPALVMNGGELVLRLQYPHVTGKWLVEPFVFGGIGWSHLTLNDAPAGYDDSDDDIGVVPVGGGLMLGHGRLILDTRFTYRNTWGEGAASGGRTAPSLDSWAVTASLGYEF